MTAPSFSEIKASLATKIFKDKNVLSPHYVPEALVYRENEIRTVMHAVAPALNGQKPRNLFVYGKTGSGKTCATKHVLKKLDEEKHPCIAQVYMNCRVYDSRYKVLQKAITSFCPDFAKTGYSFAVLYEKLLDWIEKDAKQVVLALDEIDMVKDLDSLIYTLTRVNDDLKKGGLSIVGISNKVDFKQKLGSRSTSSLCEEEIVFQPYNAKQLQGILKQRTLLAFNKPEAVQEGACNLAAAIAASENGDARYALLLLLRAGELAEKKSVATITDNEVEESRKAADEDKAFEIMSTLPTHQQLLLYALASLDADVTYKKLVEENGEKLYFSGEAYEKYRSACKQFAREPRTSRWYREYLTDLEHLGLVNMLHSGKGIRGQTTLIKLAYEPKKIKAVLEKTLVMEDKQ